jgi:hypothetical protein
MNVQTSREQVPGVSVFFQAQKFFERVNIVFKRPDKSHKKWSFQNTVAQATQSKETHRRTRWLTQPLNMKGSYVTGRSFRSLLPCYWLEHLDVTMVCSADSCCRSREWDVGDYVWIAGSEVKFVHSVQRCVVKTVCCRGHSLCYFLWVAFIAYGQFTYRYITPQLLLELFVYTSVTHTLHPARTSLLECFLVTCPI